MDLAYSLPKIYQIYTLAFTKIKKEKEKKYVNIKTDKTELFIVAKEHRNFQLIKKYTMWHIHVINNIQIIKRKC